MGTALNNPQDEELQEQEQSEELTGEDSDSEELFDNLTLDDIDYDTLTPEMKSVYNVLMKTRDDMNAGWTQKTQNLSQMRSDAQMWNSIASNPEIARKVTDILYKYQNGESLDGEEETPKDIDPNQDPIAFLDARIVKNVEKVLSKYMPEIQNSIKGVSAYVQNNQEQLEFDNLVAKYPAVKVIGLDAINQTRRQFMQSNGQPISMEQALAQMSLSNPRLLANGTQQKKQAPRTEKPTSNAKKPGTMQIPTGIRGLQQEVAKREKNGTIGNMLDNVRAALAEKFGG